MSEHIRKSRSQSAASCEDNRQFLYRILSNSIRESRTSRRSSRIEVPEIELEEEGRNNQIHTTKNFTTLDTATKIRTIMSNEDEPRKSSVFKMLPLMLLEDTTASEKTRLSFEEKVDTNYINSFKISEDDDTLKNVNEASEKKEFSDERGQSKATSEYSSEQNTFPGSQRGNKHDFSNDIQLEMESILFSKLNDLPKFSYKGTFVKDQNLSVPNVRHGRKSADSQLSFQRSFEGKDGFEKSLPKISINSAAVTDNKGISATLFSPLTDARENGKAGATQSKKKDSRENYRDTLNSIPMETIITYVDELLSSDNNTNYRTLRELTQSLKSVSFKDLNSQPMKTMMPINEENDIKNVLGKTSNFDKPFSKGFPGSKPVQKESGCCCKCVCVNINRHCGRGDDHAPSTLPLKDYVYHPVRVANGNIYSNDKEFIIHGSNKANNPLKTSRMINEEDDQLVKLCQKYLEQKQNNIKNHYGVGTNILTNPYQSYPCHSRRYNNYMRYCGSGRTLPRMERPINMWSNNCCQRPYEGLQNQNTMSSNSIRNIDSKNLARNLSSGDFKRHHLSTPSNNIDPTLPYLQLKKAGYITDECGCRRVCGGNYLYPEASFHSSNAHKGCGKALWFVKKLKDVSTSFVNHYYDNLYENMGKYPVLKHVTCQSMRPYVLSYESSNLGFSPSERSNNSSYQNSDKRLRSFENQPSLVPDTFILRGPTIKNMEKIYSNNYLSKSEVEGYRKKDSQKIIPVTLFDKGADQRRIPKRGSKNKDRFKSISTNFASDMKIGFRVVGNMKIGDPRYQRVSHHSIIRTSPTMVDADKVHSRETNVMDSNQLPQKDYNCQEVLTNNSLSYTKRKKKGFRSKMKSVHRPLECNIIEGTPNDGSRLLWMEEIRKCNSMVAFEERQSRIEVHSTQNIPRRDSMFKHKQSKIRERGVVAMSMKNSSKFVPLNVQESVATQTVGRKCLSLRSNSSLSSLLSFTSSDDNIYHLQYSQSYPFYVY